MSEFYNGSDKVQYIERAILLEDIVLPEIPLFPTLEEIQSGDVYYPRTEELYMDVIAKFSIPILTPLSDNTSNASDDDVPERSTRDAISKKCGMILSTYKESNYIELNVPKYILINFVEKVPRGTAFIAAFIGGEIRVDNIKIIGVSEYVESEEEY